MPKQVDPSQFAGKTFGYWTVVEFAGVYKRCSMFVCQCRCGKLRTVRVTTLRRENPSCGCRIREVTARRNTTHNAYHTRARVAYSSMMTRCYNPRTRSYKNYGGRGVRVCDRWKSAAANFIADMGQPPPGCSLDRIDTNGDYCPENCRWATVVEQANNKRSNTRLTYNGKTQSIADWSRETGITLTSIRKRIKRGWPAEEILTTPTRITTLSTSALLASAKNRTA